MKRLDSEHADVLLGYIECALWSSTDESDDAGGAPLDENYDAEDISDEAFDAMRDDCVDFVNANVGALADWCQRGMSLEQFGHDFWLTRNGHGTGFWDRGLGNLGDQLTDAAKPYGEFYLYVGDDGQIYSA